MMGADHGAVDHLQRVRHDPAFVQRIKDLLPQPGQRPASELTIDGRPLAELFGKVAPWRARPRNPENTIQNKAVVHWFASVRGPDSQDEALVERPLIVRHQVSCQAGLHRRYQLESRSTETVNPFCQHGLEHPWSRCAYDPPSSDAVDGRVLWGGRSVPGLAEPGWRRGRPPCPPPRPIRAANNEYAVNIRKSSGAYDSRCAGRIYSKVDRVHEVMCYGRSKRALTRGKEPRS